MERNFTDKNRGGVMDNDGSEAGFRMIDMSDENGYGSTDKGAVSSKSGPSFVSNSKSADPINYSGMENFNDNSRFTGDIGGQSRLQGSADAPGSKDSITYPDGKGARWTSVGETSPNEHGD